jgi:hypothetical protein
MKQNDLSKRLCELCGIEPVKIECQRIFDDGAEFNPNDCEGDCIDCVYYGEEFIYPDFTEPENFVKLLELRLKISKEIYLGRYIQAYEFFKPWYDRKTFIEKLCWCLYHRELEKSNRKIVKAIRGEKWKVFK